MGSRENGGGGALFLAPVAPPVGRRPRRNPTQAPHPGKSQTVPSLFPWATTRRAMVHPLDHLLSMDINKITGEVQCRRCEKVYKVEYDLLDKFRNLRSLIAQRNSAMCHRAPREWMFPNLQNCRLCHQEKCVKPLIAPKKKEINWLFLLLSQSLGFCTLKQLKYFCKHTSNHRTGAKNRVLYLTYLTLCRQLDPSGPYSLK